MDKEDLQKEFMAEKTNLSYVSWLENKVLSTLKSAKEEVKTAEETSVDKIINNLTYIAMTIQSDVQDSELSGHLVKLLNSQIDAITNASQFQSVQSFKKFSLLEESETITSSDTIPVQSVKGEGERTDDMIDFILEIDSLTTSEFCKKYNIPEPIFTGDVKSSADQFLKIDAIKHRMFVEKAKELRRNHKHSESKDMYPKDEKCPSCGCFNGEHKHGCSENYTPNPPDHGGI